MSDRPSLETAFAWQAEACETLGSPFTARLCRVAGRALASEAGTVAARLRAWPGDPSYNGDAVPLRLAAGLHALVISGADPALAAVYPPHHETADDETLWAAVSGAMARHDGQLQRWLDGPPQTNEVRRAAALYLGLMTVTRAFGLPIALTEIGSSAGLNLNLDRYRYGFGGLKTGDPDSPLTLAPEWRGPAPESAAVSVAERRGCDINPLSVDDEGDRLRLLSYLWADQAERLALTRAALAVAAAHPVTVERRDAAGFVAARLAEPRPGHARALVHSIMWQYMDEATQAAIRRSLEEQGAAATAAQPLAWLRLEPDGGTPGAALSLTLWPDGQARTLARCDFHGRWVEASPG